MLHAELHSFETRRAAKAFRVMGDRYGGGGGGGDRYGGDRRDDRGGGGGGDRGGGQQQQVTPCLFLLHDFSPKRSLEETHACAS
jgi:hypothetical protein